VTVPARHGGKSATLYDSVVSCTIASYGQADS
jgi:acyl-coenzyme A thioesterase PaaI-like protein